VSLEAARKAYRGAGNLAIDESASTGSLAAAAGYAEASAWQVQGLQTLGRLAEAQSVAEDAARVASAVLERRPNHMPALRAHSAAGLFPIGRRGGKRALSQGDRPRAGIVA
jgi:hypothetical protein